MLLCLRKAVCEDDGLVALRYPRGKESEGFPIPPDTAFTHLEGTDMLLVSYGKISERAYHVMENMRNSGVSCGLLKLTTVFPIPEDAVKIAKQYPKICFIEEGYQAGGIAEKFASALMNAGWRGIWKARTIDGFVQQGSVNECLKRVGLSEDALLACAEELAYEQPS